MKKIVFTIGSFYPAQCGGPSNSIYMLAKSLKNVVVLSTSVGINKQEVAFNKKVVFEGIEAYYFTYFIKKWFCFKLLLCLWKMCKKDEVKIVHMSSIFYPLNLFIYFILRYFNVPYSLAPRGELSDEALKYGHRYKKLYLNIVALKILQGANKIIATAEHEKIDIENIDSNLNVKILPNYYEIYRDESTKELSIDKFDSYSLLFLGRIHPIKNIELLIKTHQSLLNDFPSLILNIAGSGDLNYENYLKSLGGRNIIFHGHVDGEVKNLLIKKSSLLILPSKSENFGNVVLESIKLGTPVVASKGTPWEILEETSCGYWVEANQESLHLSIKSFLLLSNSIKLDMSINATKVAYDSFSIEHNFSNIKSTLQEID